MDPDFYRALEDRFRGSRELIKSRLQVYLPFIEPLKEAYPDLHAIDLGCGRGEWLEILGERGFQAQGVDLNAGMLSACRDLGLKVQTGDALSFLKKLSDESQVIVSAFHLVEHIPFEDLQEIVKESLRVLKPTGLLILETPNPENIIVGTSSFYMDPTHTSPIPPDLLAFLPEYYGYHKTKILRLQETPEIRELENLSFLDVLNGTSPDYAIVAQKNAPEGLLEMNTAAFNAEYGVTIEALATSYNQKTEASVKQAQVKAGQAQVKAEQAQVKAEQSCAELHRVYNSRSWQITELLRWGNLQVKLLKQHGISVRLKSLVKKVTQLAVKRSMIFVSSRPALRLKLGKISRRLGFHSALKSVYLKLNTNSISNSHNKFDLRSESLTKQPYRRSLYQPDYSGEKLSVDEILIRIRTELADSDKARNNE